MPRQLLIGIASLLMSLGVLADCMHLTGKGLEDAWGRCMRQENAQRDMQRTLEDIQKQQAQLLQQQQQQQQRQLQQYQQQYPQPKTCVRLADGSPMCFN